MKNFILLLLLLLAQNALGTTQFIFVRHAEKGPGNDPGLTAQGLARSRALVGLAKIFPLDAIYSSNAQRAIQTAAPLSLALGLTTNTSISPLDYQALLDDVLREHKDKTVLIVGHSNTIPAFINFLSPGLALPNIEEGDYSRLYLLQYGNGGAKLLCFTFNPSVDGSFPQLHPL